MDNNSPEYFHLKWKLIGILNFLQISALKTLFEIPLIGHFHTINRVNRVKRAFTQPMVKVSVPIVCLKQKRLIHSLLFRSNRVSVFY